MKWNVSVLRRSGECERIEVADFELSEFFNRIASVEGKAWVLSVERVGDALNLVGQALKTNPDHDNLLALNPAPPSVAQPKRTAQKKSEKV